MKMVGKPDAGDSHVRFEAGGRAEGPSLPYKGRLSVCVVGGWDFLARRMGFEQGGDGEKVQDRPA